MFFSNDSVEKTVKNNYDLTDSKAKTYYESNTGKNTIT